MSVALALLAMLIDAVVGYPDRLVRAIGHPVVWIGRLISALERRLNRYAEDTAVDNTGCPATSPLEGEVGERSEPGGGYAGDDDDTPLTPCTPLPDPPPQGGREHGKSITFPALRRKRGKGKDDVRVKPSYAEDTAVDNTGCPATSPLEGEVGERSEPGGGYAGDDDDTPLTPCTPLPNPPPQGGRGVRSYSTAHFTGHLIKPLPEALARLPGILALMILITVVGAVALAVQWSLAPAPVGLIVLALITSSLIAQRSLHDHVACVAAALDSEGLDAGRNAVSRIVGRDVAALDAAGVARAAIESLAENFSDGVVAPVVWLALGGLPGAAIYKATNTADSMIGHRTPRYEHFGWAAARLDDLLNLPASRLSALLLIAAAAMTSRADAARAWRAVRRDASRHRSPNAGFPEAAMAGALGLQLAGPRRYHGAVVDDAFMGDGRREASASDIRTALALYRRADALLMALLAIVAAVLIALSRLA